MTTPVLVDTKGFASVRDDERPTLHDDEKSIDSTHSPSSGKAHLQGSQSDEPDVQYGTQEDNPHGLHIKDHLGQPTAAESEILATFYEPPDEYENKHRWDPRVTWTPAEQKALLRKLDLRVALVACICFAALQLDRGNISNALSDNMLKDLHLTTAHYNLGQTIFYCCFLFAELPSQMISKKLGSDVWIPIQMMSWSAVAIAQVGLTGRTSFYITRALLGLIEGGFIADTILYLSYFYTSAELTIRLAFFWVSLTITTIIGAFLAAGILKLRDHTHLEGWRWLFAIEGTLTFLIGIFAFFYLPPGPTQTHKTVISKIRGHGWFTEREETIIVNKVLRDDPTKSSMHNREGLGFEDFWRSLSDYDMWPLYILGLTTFIGPGTVGAYFTLTLRSLGYSTFQTNLLTIPSQVIQIIGNLSLAFLSKRIKERILVSSIAPMWLFIMFIAIITIPDSTSKWGRWALLTLVQGYPYPHPILVSLNSMNAGSVRTRTVASSLYNMFVQASSLIASNIYQPKDAPFYHKGNRALLGIISANLVLFWLSKGWYIWRNNQRAKKWNSWTREEKQHYIATTKDKGNKRVDFRFLH
ncbi:hypothetical protein VHUM_01236 [Vanrija humicola]|uniref:Major facilitator superfamily (MFS) profile domain-containing protein n=1 Tax=Vanrija humicola TaxID=5417 RepID=A0A7D8ZBE9_VANHU|nr:hypothetical protein VHUM_01236 [Vanrija humicola]